VSVGTVDLGILVFYLLGVVLLGLWIGRSSKSVAEFVVGGRDRPWWLLMFSIVATETSTVTFLSIPGFAFSRDMTWLQIPIGFLIGRFAVVFLLMPQYFKGSFYTAYDVLHKRFGGATQKAASAMFIVTRSLADGLGLNRGAATHMIFRDAVSGLEYIRSCRQIAESGLWAELAAYQLQVFTDLRQVEDDSTGRYARVEAALGGEGVPSIDEAVAELVLAPVLEPFSALTAPVRLEQLREMLAGSLPEPRRQGWLAETARLVDTLAAAVLEVGDGDGEAALLGRRVTADLQALLLLAGEAAPAPAPKAKPSASEAAPVKKAIEAAGPEELPQLVARLLALDEAPGLLLSWAVTRSLGRLLDASGPIERARIWVDEWLIGTTLARSLGRAGLDEARAQRVARLLGVTVGLQSWWQLEDGTVRDAGALLELLLADRAACALIGVNLHRGVLWFHKESYEQLLGWLRLLTRAELLAAGDPKAVADQADQILCRLAQAEATAGYRVEGLREAINGPEHPGQLPS